MARLLQCLTGNALEAICGPAVTAHEYEEVKEILKMRYGGRRWFLRRAYMDQLQQVPLIRSNDIHPLEKFADLVRISGKVTGRRKRRPKLLQDHFNVLVRFRRNLAGIACEIKEMYLQTETKEQDRSHFRLLWRDLDPNREPDVFEFKRVVFGNNSAPMEFVAQANARRNQDCYPLAVETVFKFTYMDGSIDRLESDDEGVEVGRELKALWRVAGMQARKWISNSPKVIEGIPSEEHATKIVINSGQDLITKTVGISWNSTEDLFIVAASPVSPEFQATKRNVLGKVGTIFDSLGFVCPYVVVAKILLEELWWRGYDWDDEVQD
ncbi:hypothetical protein AWC38_SpisGene22811 [Stylophora pistillata]|uniref:Uncharacterized protein n=1 Tax=Stylophora pistillata TaxID=50429 RepID=A0A2B4RA71_STYPI|nr:hypothetical protein AWC38_SpisGene22811 [Stylophora pistillata]